MKNTVTKNNSVTAVLAVLLLLAGGALLGYSLYMLPGYPAYGFPWAFAGAVASFIPIAAGGWCLNLLVRRRRDELFTYGGDGNDGAIMFGIFVIIAGVLLLCFNSGVLPEIWKRVFFSWQMLLITIGTIELARRRFIGGGIFLAVGAFFVIRRLMPVYPDIAASGAWAAYWPMLLIILGVLILLSIVFRPRRRFRSCRDNRQRVKVDMGDMSGGFTQAAGFVDISTIFGSNEQVYLDPVFKGGHISTVFGGVMLDLRRTELAEGETHLKIESVFGGVEIYAPEGWSIELRNESIFGGFADKRLPAVSKTYEDGRKLVIKASNVFGGGEIK